MWTEDILSEVPGSGTRRACVAVFHLPQALTATALCAALPRAAASSRSADIAISRPTITAAHRELCHVATQAPRLSPHALQHARRRYLQAGRRDWLTREAHIRAMHEPGLHTDGHQYTHCVRALRGIMHGSRKNT